MSLRKLWYVPLEPYENRYTFQLLEWSTRQFKALGIDVEVIHGDSITQQITTGQVLDAFGRPYYAMSQIQVLLKKLSAGEMSYLDFVLFEDMFHPGIESLFYAMDQLRYIEEAKRVPKIGMRCLAQTPDPDDFVHYTGMAPWMRHYEHMVNAKIDLLFVASSEMLGYIKAAGWNVPTVVTGLPFCKEEVLERAAKIQEPMPFDTRSLPVVFASRIAKEKNIDFLVKFARIAHAKLGVVTSILSGSNVRILDLADDFPKLHEAITVGIIDVHAELTKAAYYQMLMHAKVLFNCSYQDWVSNTASEADTLGCNLLFPAYRSFPEAFRNDSGSLYIPWNEFDAVEKLRQLLVAPHAKQGQFAGRQNATNYKTLRAIQGLF